jgi:lipoprotein-anchoring transpeptidase ErfK/SrfK
MRRLVVISENAISNKKYKAIAVTVAAVFTLTSIHLAATARMATLKQQQEQLDQAFISSARCLLNQGSLALAPAPQRQNNAPAVQPKSTPSNQLQSSASAVPTTTSATATAHHRQIVISIADRQLAILDNGQRLKVYPIAVGASSTPSPDGDFAIINHAKDPTYRHGDKEIAPGKDNPLGSRWMGLSLKGYGIHGTNVQSSVGKALSHGCFRMRTHDVEELYGLVQVGDMVTVRRERDAMIAQVFAAPATTPAATNVLAAKTQPGSEVQVASAADTGTVETTEQ